MGLYPYRPTGGSVDLLEDLNEPQRQAVTHTQGPLLVLAGAGSGKTRVITRRVAWLVRQGVAPWNILAITFTNKAAGEMAQRIEALGVGRGPTVCTFHSLCARLLRQYAAEAGMDPSYSIYDRDDQLRLTKQIVDRMHLTEYRPAQLHGTISNAKNDLLTPTAYADQAGDSRYHRAVAEVYQRYQKGLSENNALDFDDLLMKMAFLLRDRPDLRQALSSKYRYILVDEYQDTNRAQYILAHGIAMDHENICVTGDPDQSIYAWRGADIRNILEFEADYPNCVTIRLEENYRSTAPILQAASALIAHNANRKDKALFTRRQGGSDVQVVYLDDEHAEADLIAEKIREYLRNGGSGGDVALFYRVNSLSRLLEEKLLRAGIAYRIARGTEFYNRRIVKDVLAYLRTIANPADDLSCLRIINSPTRGIGATTVKKLTAAADQTGLGVLELCSAPEQAGLTGRSAKAVRAFAAMIGQLAGNLERPCHQTLEEVVRASTIQDALAEDNEENQQDRANIDELISTAAEFDEANPEGTLDDYLHQISLVSDVDHLEGTAGAVTLMTLHAAKGLEFPVVFIVGCEEGLLPFSRPDSSGFAAGISPDRLEEERRLAFVGMTRAKQQLTLTAARRRMVRGRTLPQTASQFLDEIGTEGVTTDDRTRPRESIGQLNQRGGFYDPAEVRGQIESAFDALAIPVPPEYEHLKPGSMVYHGDFGQGKVLKISGSWPETRAEVLFRQWGKKRLVLAKANLELMEEF